MIWYILYDNNGVIVMHSSSWNAEDPAQQAGIYGLNYLVLDDQLEEVADWYVVGGVLTEKAEFADFSSASFAAGGAGTTVSGIPVGTRVTLMAGDQSFPYTEVVTTDSSFTLRSPYKTAIYVALDHPTRKRKEVVLYAV